MTNRPASERTVPAASPGSRFSAARALASRLVAALTTRRPERIMLAFPALMLLGAGALTLPQATADGRGASAGDSLFAALTAVCGTGFSRHDIGAYFSVPGQLVLLVLMELGALGFMALASVVALHVTDRLGLRSRMLAAPQVGSTRIVARFGPGGIPGPRQVSWLIRGVLRISLAIQGLMWLALWLRLSVGHGLSPLKGLWESLFLTVSAFSNTGLTLHPSNRIWATPDPWLMGIVLAGVLAGGLGYPVLHELRRSRRWKDWSLHSRLTLITTVLLLVIGPLAVAAAEWGNPATLGVMSTPDAALSAFFGGIGPRSSGFTAFDYANAHPDTLAITSALMFIGGGSAGTAGGIKVATLAVIALSVLTELRTRRDVVAFGRRISNASIRQALTVVAVTMTITAIASLLLVALLPDQGSQGFFTAVSALSTCGLSAVPVQDLQPVALSVLACCVVIGRFGPLWLATRLAIRDRHEPLRFPEARPLVG